MSPRRLYNLVVALPDGAATARAADTSQAWTIDAHFLASILETLRSTNDLLGRAHFEKPRGGWPELQHIRRPGVTATVVEVPPTASPDEMRSFFGGARFVPEGG